MRAADLAMSATTPEGGAQTNALAVEVWTGRDASGRADVLVHQRFEAMAAAKRDAVAVVSASGSLTYAKLNARADRLARHLAGLGVGPEARVGICLERGPEMVVGILGVLKAGGAYVPLDPGYPAERLDFMLADAGVAVLLTQDSLRGLLRVPAGVHVVSAESMRAEPPAASAEPPARTVDPDGLAYVIYTSGSTGRPKGVMVSHRNLASSTAAREWFYPEAVGAYLLLSSIAFDSSVAGLFWTLCGGGALVIPGADELGDAGRLRGLVDRAGVTHLLAVPSLYAQLVDGREAWGDRLRTVIVAGEPCTPELVERHRARFAGVELVNEYGPTEATVWSSAHRCGAEAAGAPVPIGTPVGDTRASVLDAALRTVPADAAGELYVGGTQVARGYLGRPGLTAERFLPDPLGGPGARVYRTGDRVRWRGGAVLEFLGRMDEQVKIRGFRVEPGEVEAVLRRSPDVGECAVVAREDAAGELSLVAYVTGPARPEALRAELRRTLPGHMVPSAIVPLDRLPLTPNGKLDRKALPAPRPAPAEEGHPAPRTPVEAALAGIWREVLGLEHVGVDRPFLELGGHSLRAMRVIARIADAFGVRIAPGVLLRHGSIEAVAAAIGAAGAAPEEPVPALVRVSRDGPIPLSYSQEATWFFEQFAPGQMAYRAQSTVRIRGALGVEALEWALGEIVRRHEIFRTTFPVENGAPRQRIHAPWRVRLPVFDVSGVDAAEREAAARRIVDDEFLKPFDTAALPLVWWSLVRVSAGDHVFVIVEHHFIHDGWSAGVFLRDLRAVYEAYLDGRPSPLPEPAVQFADFAAWQRAWMESGAARARLRFWEEALAGVPPLALPTDFPRPPVMRFRGARERVPLAPALVRRARAFSREHGVTLFVTLLSAFQALLGRYSGQRDFCVGSGLGNRGHVALEDVIGMVVNTVALRARLEGDPTGVELLRRVNDTTLRAYEHQDVPFDQVVRRIRPDRTSDALPVYQVAFSFHDSPMAGLSFRGLHLELEEAQDNGSSKYDVQVIVIPRAEQGGDGRDDEVVMVWEYNTDLFRPATLRRMIAHYGTLLDGLVADPGRRLSALPLLGEDERRRVVEEWNRTDAPPADGRRIHERIAEHAARTPDAAAVVDSTRTLTYGELDRRAARLARALRARGVGPEVRVGVCMERGAELAAAWLGVLRAGGAYVPLDPRYPAERLAYMLSDSGAAVLLTEGSLRAALPVPAGVQVVEVDGEEAGGEDGGPLESGVTAASLAYVIYTSGSTGRPKGVAVTHGGLAALCAWHADAFAVTAADRATQLASPAFDAAGWEVWPYLSRGACVLVAPEEVRTDPAGLRDWLLQRGATLAFVPTPLAGPLLELAWPADAALRALLTGGDRLRTRPRPGLPLRLSNNYGPTESTVVATSGWVDADGAGTPTIGGPIQNTRAYVLDPALLPQPAGVPGELFLGGAQVARGYLGRPALTAERFVPDPFGAAGGRLYRTGDRARWREDGTLDYLGRLDEQVKVRGFRIEPGEVEAALRAHPAVRDCVVVAREDRPGETRLAAYVAGGAEARPDALAAFLGSTLPAHMVPSTFTLLPSLPLTANGKVDRGALPAPEAAPAPAEHVAPATDAERGIALVWQEALGCERVGAHDDFFALGGDSLLATRVVLRTRELLEREVPLAALFSHRTLAAFARAAGAAPPASAAPGSDLLSVSRMRRAAARGGSGAS